MSSYRIRRIRRTFAGLPRRARLTLRHHGPRETLRRAVTFPLRLTGVMAPRLSDPSAAARRWYATNARPVAVVIPSYGPAELALVAARSVKRTTTARVIVADDGSPPAEVEKLRASAWVDEVVAGENRGFAANCNRGIALTRPDEDVVLLNSDVVAEPGWLEPLQHAAYEHGAGITGAKLLYPDSSIQFAGMIRNPSQPTWFDHRHRGANAERAEADVMQATLAVTGACMYITRGVLDDVGTLEEAYPMAFEDVDYCLRAWWAGHRVLYVPASVLVHRESASRGLVQGERELRSHDQFWARWADKLDHRDVRTADGALRVVYVTRDTGIAGGHRVLFTHLNGLRDRGHEVELWTLAEPPDWFDLRAPVRRFASFEELRAALAPVDALKVATWWETAECVWEASVAHGIPIYWVQDIETGYYRDPEQRARVVASYRPDFRYFAGSQWIAEQLRAMRLDATVVTPALDDAFHPLPDVARRDDVVLALGRSEAIKRFDLTRAAYLALPEPRPQLWLFGSEPELAAGLGARYVERPSDEEVNRLLNEATILLQTSEHEGFCLPLLEAMGAGAAVVCTDAHGNRDFCLDGENCLMAEATPSAVAGAVSRLLADRDLRARLTADGHRTTGAFRWPERIDAIERHFTAFATR